MPKVNHHTCFREHKMQTAVFMSSLCVFLIIPGGCICLSERLRQTISSVGRAMEEDEKKKKKRT